MRNRISSKNNSSIISECGEELVSSNKIVEYTRYPLSNIIIYNIVTIFHFLFGGLGIILGYTDSGTAYLFGVLYLAFAFIQMYILMPRTVCPNCVYYALKNGRCTSGLNILSRKIAKEGSLKDFSNRVEGLFCHNNLYLAALVAPIIIMIPLLILNFSFVLLLILLTVVGLLLFRFFVIFTKIACVHCCAKTNCPNAKAMDISTLSWKGSR